MDMLWIALAFVAGGLFGAVTMSLPAALAAGTWRARQMVPVDEERMDR